MKRNIYVILLLHRYLKVNQSLCGNMWNLAIKNTTEIMPYEKHIQWTDRLLQIHESKNNNEVIETALFILFKVLKVNHKDFLQKDVQCHIRQNIVDPLIRAIPSLTQHTIVAKYFF